MFYNLFFNKIEAKSFYAFDFFFIIASTGHDSFEISINFYVWGVL